MTQGLQRSYQPLLDVLHAVQSYLPTGSLRERYVVRMVLHGPFDKFNAREIFPMFHRLFEQSFMFSTKISIYFVGNDSVVPNSFLSCSRRSRHSPEKKMKILVKKKIWKIPQRITLSPTFSIPINNYEV